VLVLTECMSAVMFQLTETKMNWNWKWKLSDLRRT